MRVERTQEEIQDIVGVIMSKWLLAKEHLLHVPRASREGVSIYDETLTTEGVRARAVALAHHCLDRPVTEHG